MAFYEYKCINKDCKDFDAIKIASIPMSEYSEDKLPECDECHSKTVRNYTANAHQLFGDNGYRS